MTDNLEELEHCKKCIHAGDDCGEHNPTWEQLAEYWRNQANATAREVEALRAEVARLKARLAAIGPHMKVDPAAIYPQSGGAALEGKGG